MGAWVGRRAVVVGASRGFGRGIAEALAEAGAEVHALSRTGASVPVGASGGRIHTIAADATDSELPARLLGELKPTIVVLDAGATPEVAPIQDHSWESFSVNWNTDVKMTFHWLKAILRQPLAEGSSVIAMSSGAALKGSPLSGGYAGAKATVRFMTEYAAIEAARAKLGIRFVSLLPKITSEGGVGRPFVEAYAKRQGRTVEQFLGGAQLTSAAVGAAVVRLVLDRTLDGHGAFRLDAVGLAPLEERKEVPS
jgi:NAD(P)-dependent dehydrogenase (short-subunit alcohol dehydrogenase family)